MSIEQKLRDNLRAAADALVVPQPKVTPQPRRVPTWRHGVGLALAAAATVLALAVPALILWSGGGSSPEFTGPARDQPSVVGSTGVPQTTAPTSTTPETTTSSADTPTSTGTVANLDQITVGDHRLSLVATLVDEAEPPSATVVLQVTAIEGTEPTDEAVVGTPAAFFWHVVSGEDALCEFSAEQTEEGVSVTVQIQLSPSLGCSDPYMFLLNEGELTPDLEAPELVAQQFVASWAAGDEETMADLAEPDVMSQTAEMAPPTEPMFSYCEGVAGSVYCTFEVVGGELAIRVNTEPPSWVTEVRLLPDN